MNNKTKIVEMIVEIAAIIIFFPIILFLSVWEGKFINREPKNG